MVFRQNRIGGVVAAAALLLPALVSAPAFAQPAPYLKGARNPVLNDTGVAGVWNMQGHVSSSEPVRKQGAFTEEGKVPPLLPEAKTLYESRLVAAENGKPFAHMGTRCLPEGVPLMLFAAVEGPVEILETPGRVTILSQEFGETWLIYMDQKHRPDPDPTWHGDSVGHWEGKTLVIDSIALNPDTTIDHVGMPHSEDLRVVTRLTRLDKETLEVRATMYDAKTFSAPWTRRFIYKRAKPGERVEEQVCDNRRNDVDSEGNATFVTYEDQLKAGAPK